MAYTSIRHTESYNDTKKCEFFDIVRQGTFYIQISPCHKIEELSDTFMTREALELMNAGDDNWEWNSHIYFGAEITEALKEWIEMIPEGCQCTGKQPPSIRTLYRELSHDQIRNRMPPGYTIRGDKIINKEIQNARIEEAAQKERECAKRLREERAAAPYIRPDYVTRSDLHHIGEAFDRMLADEYGMECSRRHYYDSKQSIFIFYKRLCGWDVISKYHRKHHQKKKYVQDLKFMKKLWDDPSLEP
jgi:hypothetical protein